MTKEKLCPFCYKSIAGSYVEEELDFKCPHCSEGIPKVYLKYPVRHVVSISNKEGLKGYPEELESYVSNSIFEKRYSRVECYAHNNSDETKFVVFEYLKEENSFKRQTEVIVFHSHKWDLAEEKLKNDLEYASGIVVNLDITDIRALYFNLEIERTEEDLKQWNPRAINQFVRELGDYLKKKRLTHKTAVLLGNMQYLQRLADFQDINNEKYALANVELEWTSGYNDRMWMKEANEIICKFLREIGEERLVEEAANFPATSFFLYSDSAHRMTSNTFWLSSVLLWLCENID